MEKIQKRLESEESVIRYVVLVLLGAGINFSIGFGVMISSLTALVSSPTQTLSSNVPQTVSLLVTAYLVIGIVYASTVSLIFRPKRIISPLYIQIVTAAFVPIFIVYLSLKESTLPDLGTTSALALGYFIIALIMFFVAGIGQTIIVKYLVGLNGTKENAHSFGLMIDSKIENVLKVLRRDDLQEALGVIEERGIGRHFYLFTRPPNTRNRIFIAIVTDPEDAQKTQLATLSYAQTYYGIFKPHDLVVDQRKNTLIKALKMAGMRPLNDNTDSLARHIVYRYGLSVTESKLLSLKSLPPYSRAIGIGVALMAVMMTALWKYNFLSPEMFETFWIFAGFAILFDFLPLLRTKRRDHKDKLD